MGRREKKTVTLEDYQHFLENPKDEAFTIDQLNEVIFMHGFRKIHKRQKSVLYEALSTIDLMHPERSTLGDTIFPADFGFSVEEMKQDLEALNWDEDHIIESVDIVGKLKSNSHGCGVAVASKDFLPMPSFKITRKRRRPRMKRMKRWSIAGGDFRFGPTNFPAAGADVDSGDGVTLSDGSLYADTYSWDF